MTMGCVAEGRRKMADRSTQHPDDRSLLQRSIANPCHPRTPW
jgi:hypothetical protein